MKNIKLHIGGVYYGLHNIGDEAILLSMINSFSRYSISVSSFGSEWAKDVKPDVKLRNIEVDYVKPKLGLYVDPKKQFIKNYPKIKKEQKFYSEKDFYICGGATILSDCPWYSLRTVEIAGKSGTPVILWGVGMAEINDPDAPHYITEILSKEYVKKIFTRDLNVKDRLCKLGVAEEKVAVSFDPAIMIDGESNEAEAYMSNEQLKLYCDSNPNFVFSISGESDVVKRTPIAEIKKAIQSIQVYYNANIFLVPTGCGAHCKDIEMLQGIERDLNNSRVTTISTEFSPAVLVGFLKNVKVIVSSRLHLNIFGACAGTPSIGLVRNQKIIDFAKLLDMPYLELENASASSISNSLRGVLENYDTLTETIKKRVRSMRSQYNVSLEEAIAIIEGNN